jgi:hypothetical protein
MTRICLNPPKDLPKKTKEKKSLSFAPFSFFRQLHRANHQSHELHEFWPTTRNHTEMSPGLAAESKIKIRIKIKKSSRKRRSPALAIGQMGRRGRIAAVGGRSGVR